MCSNLVVTALGFLASRYLLGVPVETKREGRKREAREAILFDPHYGFEVMAVLSLGQGVQRNRRVMPNRSWFPVPGPIDVDILIFIALGQLQLEMLGQEVLKEALCPVLLSHLGGQVNGAIGSTQVLEGAQQQWEGGLQVHDISTQHQVIVSRENMLVNPPGQGTDLGLASSWHIGLDVALDLL